MEQKEVKYSQIFAEDILEDFDRAKKSFVKKNIIVLITYFICVFLLVALSIICNYIYLLIFTLVIAFFIAYFYTNGLDKKAKILSDKIKQYVLPNLLASFKDIKYLRSNGGLYDPERVKELPSEYDIANSKIIPMCYESVLEDDAFVGEHKGMQFGVCELCMKIAGKKSETTTFNGAILKINLNKSIEDKIVVLENKANACLIKDGKKSAFIIPLIIALTLFFVERFAKDINSYFSYNWPAIVFFLVFLAAFLFFCAIAYELYEDSKIGLPKANHLCDKFNRMYKIFSNNENFAEVVLEKEFIEILEKLKKVSHSYRAEISIFEDKLICALATECNLFEVVSLSKFCNSKKIVQETLELFETIYYLIDYLDDVLKKH